VTGRLKVGDVEEAGGTIGKIQDGQDGGDGELACSTIPAKQGKKC
jgi:hypothetical protein